MNEYQRYLLEEFADEHREGHMSRRDLLRRAVLIMGSAPAGLAALAAVGCGGDDDDETTATEIANTAAATPSPAPSPTTAASPTRPAGGTVSADGMLTIKGPTSDLVGYLVEQPGTPRPGIIVIHENRGLVPHIKDVADRYGKEGFTALAVDLVSREGGSKADAGANTGALGRAKPEDLVADLVAYIDHLAARGSVKPGGVGVTGFCFGGGYAFEAAIASAKVKAAVPYYGICRLIDDLPTTKAAVMAMYGGNDARVTGQAEKVKEQLAKTGRPYDVRIYEGANHAFFNDTGGNYNKAAAEDAWTRTLAWFREHVA